MINVLKAPWGKKDGSQVTWALKRGVTGERFSLMSQPIDCATKQTKKWLTDGAHRGGTEDKRIDLPRLEGREGQGLLSCLQWKRRERTED